MPHGYNRKILQIGPAGEKLVRFACLINNCNRKHDRLPEKFYRKSLEGGPSNPSILPEEFGYGEELLRDFRNFVEPNRSGGARIMVPAQAVCPTCRGYGGVGPYECSRCAGEGALSGEIPVSVTFPPGLAKDHAVMIPLDRFGIRDVHITVLFRPTGGNAV